MDTPRDTSRPSPARAARPPAGTDKRQAPRRGVRGIRCRVQTGSRWLWVSAGIVDFSIKGVRLRTPLAWPAGQTRKVRLTAGPVRLELLATCIWARQEGRLTHMVGAAFQGITPAQEGLLAELLARHGVDPILSEAA